MKKDVKDKAHHSIMLITGARKPVMCPECGEGVIYRCQTYDRTDELFDDGHEIEGYYDWSYGAEYCSEDCGYQRDW